jgi:hypothetical protein
MTLRSRLVADAETIFNAAYAAVRADADSDELRVLLRTDPPAALRGIKQALADGAEWWQVVELTNLFTVEDLQRADVGDELLGIKRASLQRDQNTALALREIQKRQRERRRQREAELAARYAPDATGLAGTGPGALAALLTRPREHGDPWILRDAFNLVRQVSSLTVEQREDLRQRLAEWWPDKPFIETIHRSEERRFSIEDRAGAWLWLAPALDIAPNKEQWAQLATSGVIGTSQRDWLRRHASPESVRAATELLDAPDVDRWYELLGACPPPPPPEPVDKMVACAREPASDAVHAELAKELVQAGHTEAARVMGEKVAGFEDALRPLLAAAGELAEQEVLLDEMLQTLRGGGRIHRQQAEWMHGISDDSLLPRLFEILRLAVPRVQVTDDRDMGWYHYDVINPTVNAIITIGGEVAVAGYDELIREDLQFRWLRNQRDKVAESVLRMDGLEAAPTAARAAGVPALRMDE